MGAASMLPEYQLDTIASLVAKMRGLGITAHPQTPIAGPIVTAYPFKLPDSVPLSKLYAREEDLALAAGVESLDIRRIGDQVIIFVPNKERKVVQFIDVLTWYLKDEIVKKQELPLMLGVDYRGSYATLDLAEMPHILIAGSTGSGKSVFESSIIAALSTIKTEEELELYLVDTKQLDLTLFNGLGHVKKVVRRVEEWYRVINKLFQITEHRLTELSGAKVRNIREYNSLGLTKMPYIVIVIDELADLIMHDKALRDERKQNELDHDEPKVIESIKRLIQICRAAGVHIIACTQRTSVDVVSGTVKANFPARISLRLPTSTDSRTILGQIGAENLLGKGDMLVQRPDCDNLERYHGPFVRLDDIAQVIMHQDMIKKMLGVV